MMQKSESSETPSARADCTGATTISSAAMISNPIMKRMAGSR